MSGAEKDLSKDIMTVGPYCLSIERFAQTRDGHQIHPVILTWATNKWARFNISYALPDKVLDRQEVWTKSDMVGWVSYVRGALIEKALQDLLLLFDPSTPHPATRAVLDEARDILLACGWTTEHMLEELTRRQMALIQWEGTETSHLFQISGGGYESLAKITGPLTANLYWHQWAIPTLGISEQREELEILDLETAKTQLVTHYRDLLVMFLLGKATNGKWA